jgi:predicted amidohydrolase
MLRVGAVQLEPVTGDVDTNLDASRRLVHHAAQQGAQWVLLPPSSPPGWASFRSLPPRPSPWTGRLSR